LHNYNYAASNNSLVEAYVGKSPVNNNSSKYRDIAERFKQGLAGKGLITVENLHPLTLVYRKNSGSGAGVNYHNINTAIDDGGDSDDGSSSSPSNNIISTAINVTTRTDDRSVPKLTSKPSPTSSASTTAVAVQANDIASAAREEKLESSVCNNSEIAAAAIDTITANSQCKEESSLAGLPYIPCIFCRSYQTPIEFDLALHLQEYHRVDLVTNLSMELSILGKSRSLKRIGVLVSEGDS
jgi:hypothetical protein